MEKNSSLIQEAKDILQKLTKYNTLILAYADAAWDPLSQCVLTLESQPAFKSCGDMNAAVSKTVSQLETLKGAWGAVLPDLESALKEMDSINPSGALFRLFPNEQLQVLQDELSSIRGNAQLFIKDVTETLNYLKTEAEKAQNIHVHVGPYGQSLGNCFSDPEQPYTKKLTRIVCRSGSLVDNLQFFYGNVTAGPHGGGGGGQNVFELMPGEEIVRIQGSFSVEGDIHLRTLQFTSNKNRTQSWGQDRGNHVFDVSIPGAVLSSISGSFSWIVQSITFVFTHSSSFPPVKFEDAMSSRLEEPAKEAADPRFKDVPKYLTLTPEGRKDLQQYLDKI